MPLNALTNSVATLTTGAVALGTMGMVRDMVRDTQRRAPARPRKSASPPRRRTMKPARRRSVLDDPFGGNW